MLVFYFTSVALGCVMTDIFLDTDYWPSGIKFILYESKQLIAFFFFLLNSNLKEGNLSQDMIWITLQRLNTM